MHLPLIGSVTEVFTLNELSDTMQVYVPLLLLVRLGKLKSFVYICPLLRPVTGSRGSGPIQVNDGAPAPFSLMVHVRVTGIPNVPAVSKVMEKSIKKRIE